MSERQVFLATRNAKKLAELRRILEPLVPGIAVLGLDDVIDYPEPAETEPSFAGNAQLKAEAALRATGLPSLADDSGLCVEALNGMPGVLSARWSGVSKDDAANNTLLLAQLSDVPDERRGAQFVCAVALALPTPSGDAVLHLSEGVMPGRILREQRGTNGFGYDVLFSADGEQISNAELEPAAKDARSHRGQALRAMTPHLVAWFAQS